MTAGVRSGAAGEGLAAWLVSAGLLACGVVAAGAIGLAPRPGRPVAALFPPWWGAERALAAAASAQGVVARTGAWPTLLVASSGAAGLGGRLRSAGAWLILDARPLGGCAPPSGTP